MNESEKTYNYVIIGCGITGAAAGRILQQRGNNNFLILESENCAGGLCRTEEINGHQLDIGGGHVLHSVYEDVLEWIFSHIPKKDFNTFNTKVLIDLEGTPIEFPIELNLWQLPTDKQVEYLYSYLTVASKDIKPDNFEHWIRNYLGDKIADNYMIPYNQKLWCMDISKLNTDWLIKIPKTNIKLILKSIIEKNANFTKEVVSHRSFYYPKYGGFQSIFDAIYNPIKANVRLEYPVSNLKYNPETKTWLVNDEIHCDKIINTAPWILFNIELDGFDFKNEFKNLEYLSNVISLWESEPYTHGAHWKYIPNPKIEHHREFYIHNFAPHSKEGGIMTDINQVRWLQFNKKWKAGVPLHEHVNHYSYPLPTKLYKESINNILTFTKQYNMFGLGRWGQWQYFNIDHCIKQVLDFFDDEHNFDYFKIFK